MKFIETVPVLLCGGAGTRLWPLSRKDLPKQFVEMFDGQSLFDLAVLRASGLDTSLPAICVTNENCKNLVAKTLKNQRQKSDILVEPVAKNTAAAVCSAALWLMKSFDDVIMIVLPCDQVIEDIFQFRQVVDAGIEVAKTAEWVLLGIEPTSASDLYGYVEPGAASDKNANARQVVRFIEKPNATMAARLIKQGSLWNAGVFVVRASVAVKTIKQHAPQVYQGCQLAVENVVQTENFVELDGEHYDDMPALQLDKSVLEHLTTSHILPYRGTWSDVGSFAALAEFATSLENGNQVTGNAFIEDGENLFVHSPSQPTVALGVKDLTIVNTPEALLVAHKDAAHDTASLLENMDEKGFHAVTCNNKVLRPWGFYEVIAELENCKVKRVVVDAGASLSSQFHYHRAEHWVITSGTATITKDGEKFELAANESVFIPQNVIHRLSNETRQSLELIEVQTGAVLLEEDIVRLDDVYGR